MAQSWFFLTLWRGTPPEMTDYSDTIIDTGEEKSIVEITQRDKQAVPVYKKDCTTAGIFDTDYATVTVHERDEVIWIVGKEH